jgi:hypothetical protein
MLFGFPQEPLGFAFFASSAFLRLHRFGAEVGGRSRWLEAPLNADHHDGH